MSVGKWQAHRSVEITSEARDAFVPARPRLRQARLLKPILLLALALNGGWLLAHPPGLESGETSHWWPVVLNVAHGRGYVGCFPEYFPFCRSATQATAAREPAPVLLFAGVARLTGDSLRAASVVEVLLNLVVLIALFSLARELAGERVAALASLVWLFYLPALKLIPQVSGDLLATLGVVAGLFFFLRAWRTAKARYYIAAGVCLALGVLSRSAVLVVAPTLAAGAIYWQAGGLGKRLRPVALFGLAFLAPLVPWTARNYVVFGRPVFGSTLAGYNLYRQNYLLTKDDFLRFVAGEEAGRAVEALMAQRPDLRGDENEAQMEGIYRQEAERVIRARPLRYSALSAYRFLLLWFGWGYLDAYGVHPRSEDYLLMLEQGLLLALAGVGLYHLGLRAWPLAASVVGLSLLHMAVISQLRYLVPAMPLTITLSSAGFFALAARIRKKPPAANPA